MFEKMGSADDLDKVDPYEKPLAPSGTVTSTSTPSLVGGGKSNGQQRSVSVTGPPPTKQSSVDHKTGGGSLRHSFNQLSSSSSSTGQANNRSR